MKIVLFVLLFCPIVVLYKLMSENLPETMQPINLLLCLLLMYFIYVWCTIKTEVLVVKKKEIVKVGRKTVKILCVNDNRCFEVWNGFNLTMILFEPFVWLNMMPRLTDQEFKKIKVGQKYRIKHYYLLGTKNRCIWSVDKIKK